MLLARDAGQERDWADAAAPAASQAEQAPAHDAGGEVLLRDGHLATRPALAELMQVGEEDVRQGRVEGRSSQEAVERRLRRWLVVGIERGLQLRVAARRAPSAGGSSSSADAPRASAAASAAANPRRGVAASPQLAASRPLSRA